MFVSELRCAETKVAFKLLGTSNLTHTRAHMHTRTHVHVGSLKRGPERDQILK